MRTAGQPLGEAVRSSLEPVFARDLSQVRIHADGAAARSARAVQARAYTVGQHVAFDSGEYAPDSGPGRQLLAHELVHVMQQSGEGASKTGGSAESLESQANRISVQALAGQPVQAGMISPSQPVLSRQPKATGSSPPSPIQVVRSADRITVLVDGQPLLTVIYDPAKGNPSAGTWQAPDGSHMLSIVVPPYAYKHTDYNSGMVQAVRQRGYVVYEYGPQLDESQQTLDEVEGYTIGVTSPSSTPQKAPVPPKASPQPKAQPAPVKQPPKPEPESKPLPQRSAEELIDSNTSLLNLDEEKLGKDLLAYAKQGSFATVYQTLEELGSTDRDDVSLELVKAASDADLEAMAKTEEGRKLLLRLYDELTSGHLGEDESAQAERIMRARAQQIDPKKLIEAESKAMVIPYSGIGFTKFSSASLSVRRLDNGKIQVRSHMKTEHYQDARRLPSAGILYGSGVEIDPDEIVGIHLYDEGGKVVYVPAIYLLQLSNQEDTKALTMAGEAVVTGLTMGAGGEAVAGAEAATGTWAARGLTALKWADRAAMTIGAASTLINDHRGLIIKHFGKDGEEFLKYWGTVERVVAIYGLARGAVALGQTVGQLRKSYQNWQALKAQAKNLSAEERQALDNMALQAENSIKDLEDAQLKAATEVAPKGVSPDTVKMLAEKPELAQALAKNPRAATALTLCKSPCIPDFATPQQVARIEQALADAEKRGLQLDQKALKEYFHRPGSEADLTKAIDEFEQAARKAKPGGSSLADSIFDEAEALQQPGVRKGKPVDVRLQEAQAGNLFDTLEGQKYPANQVPIRDKGGSLRRLDSYDPVKKEIISRKSLSANQGQIAFTDEFTMIDYFQEFALKYPNGAIIADTTAAKNMKLANQTLQGKYVLEVPVQAHAIPDRILQEAAKRGITIRDINGKIYN